MKGTKPRALVMSEQGGKGVHRAGRGGEWVSAIITVQESALINAVMCGCKMSIIAEHGSAKCRWAVDAGTAVFVHLLPICSVVQCTMQCLHFGAEVQ